MRYWWNGVMGLAAVWLMAVQAFGQEQGVNASTYFRTGVLTSVDAPTARANLGIVTSNWAFNLNQLESPGNQLQIKAGAPLTNAQLVGPANGNGFGISNASPTSSHFSRWNVKDFGAKGSGVAANGCYMTNGNATLISTGAVWTAGDVGKIVSVYSGQTNLNLTTTISVFNNATNVTLTAAPAFGCTNTFCVYGGDDDTAAIQAGINTVATNGGTLFFPPGIYVVNGAIQDPGGTNHHNAQLFYPDVPSRGQTTPTITFEGPSAPQTRESNKSVGTTAVAAQGAVVWSTLANLAGGRVLDCQNLTAPAWTNAGQFDRPVQMNAIGTAMRNMTWRVAGNPNGSCLDLEGSQSFRFAQVLVDSGYALYCVPQPSTTNSWGVFFPAMFANGPVEGTGLTVVGFYNGLGAGEHAGVGHVEIFSCWNGLDLTYGSTYPMIFTHLDVEACHVWITGGAHPSGLIANITGENEDPLVVDRTLVPQIWDSSPTPPWFLNTGFPGALFGDILYDASPKTTNLLMTAGTAVMVRQFGYDGANTLAPTYRTPLYASDIYSSSLTATGANFNLVVSQANDSKAAKILYRTTSAGNYWELDKDVDSGSGYFVFRSSTNAGANLNAILHLNGGSGQVVADFGGTSGGFVGYGGGLTGVVNVAQEFLRGNVWDIYPATVTQLSRQTQSAAPYTFSDGVSIAGNNTGFIQWQIPSWVNTVTLSGYWQATGTQAFTNNWGSTFAALDNSVGNVAGGSVNQTIVCTNGLNPFTVTLTLGTTNALKTVQLVANPSTNVATRYLIGPLTATYQ